MERFTLYRFTRRKLSINLLYQPCFDLFELAKGILNENDK